MTAPRERWQLVDHDHRHARYLTIELDGVRIADVFPDAGMYRIQKIEPEWIIRQAQRLVNAMNTEEAAP